MTISNSTVSPTFCKTCYKSKQSGITLIEIIVVIAIIGILISMATPQFKGIIVKKDLNSARASLLLSLNKAKNIARTQSTVVNVTVEDSIITISPGNSTKTETMNMPTTVNASHKISFRFNAMGMATTQADAALENDITITIKPSRDETLSTVISVTPMGLVTAGATIVTVAEI